MNSISTVVGTGTVCSSTTATCGDGAAATGANLAAPYYVAFDKAGNLYIADTNDNRVRKVNAVTGVITTVAGNGTACSAVTAACGDGGSATSANLKSPRGIAIDAAGNLYIADYSDNRIRKVDASGNISTYAGTGANCATATAACGDGAAATAALLRNPYSIALDASGNLYIADLSDNRIRKVDATTGFISTVAGSGTACAAPAGACGDGGPATAANLTTPTGMTLDLAGNLYIADYGAHKIRKVSAATGLISTIAGIGSAGFSGDGGAATSAALNYPAGLIVDRAGNVYVADYANNRVRKIDAASGLISTFAGTGTACSATTGLCGDGGASTSATIGSPYSVALDVSGNLYIPDRTNNRIRKVAPSVIFPRTIVGASTAQNVLFTNSTAVNITAISVPVSQGGKQEYTAAAATGCTVDPTGATTTPASTTCVVPVTFSPAYSGQRMLPMVVTTTSGSYQLGLTGLAIGPQVAISPGVVSTIAGTGSACPDPATSCGDGSAATSAALNVPYGSAVDASGNVYFADAGAHRVRKLDAVTGKISTVAGTGVAGSSGDGAAATNARLNSPRGIALDAAGNIYVADFGAHVVRKISAGTGLISTVAGSGTACSISTAACGDGGAATAANLNSPAGLAVDSYGNLYIADYGDHRVREVYGSNGLIATVAGTGTSGSAGDGSAATAALLTDPAGLAIDTANNLYIADVSANVVRKVEPFLGTIGTIAGTGTAASNGDGAAATSASIKAPIAVAVDSAGNLYIASNGGNNVRKVNAASGIISTIAGTGTAGSTGDGGASTVATFQAINSVTTDALGNIYIVDAANYKLRKVDSTGGTLTFATATTEGTLDSADGAQTATISNIGNSTLTFAVPSAGNNPSISSSFAWNNMSTCTQLTSSSSATTLVSGASCGIAVDFIPATSGTITGAIVTSDNALNVTANTQTIVLHGTGVAATVAGDATSTVVSLSTNSIGFGQSVTLSARVTPATSTGTPTGAITFTDTVGTSIITIGSQALSAGAASLSFTPVMAGTHVITATFTSSDTAIFQSSADSVGKTLTVTKVAPALTVNAASIVYGAASASLSATVAYSGNVVPTGAVTFTVDGGSAVAATCTGSSPLTCRATYATSSLSVGATHTISVVAAADTNYSAATATGTLTVTPATPTLTVSSITINVGSSPTTLTAGVGFTGPVAPSGAVTFTVNGGTAVTATCTGTASPRSCTASYLTSTLVSGNYTIAASLAADSNYNSTSATGTLTATAQDFSFVSSGSTNVSVAGGSPATFTYTISPVGNIYPATVALTVAGLPSAATYSFSPSSVASSDGMKTVTLTIQTTQSMAIATMHQPLSWTKNATIVLGILVLPLCFRRRIRKGIVLSALLLSVPASTMLMGCGTSKAKGSGTSYTVVAIATSGTVSKRVGSTLTVK